MADLVSEMILKCDLFWVRALDLKCPAPLVHCIPGEFFVLALCSCVKL